MKSFGMVLNDSVLFPVRVCVITRMDGAVIRITEMGLPEELIIGGDTFSVVPGFEISAIKHTVGGEMPSVEFTSYHAEGETFDTRDIANGLFDGASVKIYIVDYETVVLSLVGLLFTGIIEPVTWNTSGQATFDVRGQATQATGVFVQEYATMCRTDLFSVLCGLDADDFDVAGTIATIVDNYNVTVTISSPPADGYFNQGVGKTDTNFAFEIANWVQSSGLLTTYLPVCVMFSVGQDVTLWPGCDKRIATCNTKFSNALNHQAEPHFLGAAAASADGQ